MNPLLVGPIADLLKDVMDRVWPDAEKAAEAKQKIVEMQLSGELQERLSQIEVNKVEAASTNMFVAGWRPFIGWTCGSAYAFQFVLAPLLVMIFGAFGVTLHPPILDIQEIGGILGALLGLGYYRTKEKINKVA